MEEGGALAEVGPVSVEAVCAALPRFPDALETADLAGRFSHTHTGLPAPVSSSGPTLPSLLETPILLSQGQSGRPQRPET